ncbi:MAG: Protein of unknown function precursor [Bacteroidetes bacterium]|nr:Protein of unknown function precursor [Bacteroidota bacterium]
MKNLFTIVAVLVINTVLVAAPPPVSQKISYQAVVRNSNNALVINQIIGMKISVLYGSETGTVVYAETQTPITNANGLINISIGSGNVVSGTYSFIEWGTGTHFIKTEIDPTGGIEYTITSTAELLSVPYALYSNYTKTAMNAQSLTLPFTNSSSYAETPFSITNTGSAWYTIAGLSDSGYGIYGKTKATNAAGVIGYGTGADYSSGVVGVTGEGSTPILAGNTGVLGQSNAHIAVAGTAISGIGGYFSSSSGLALNTKGNIKLTGIGEAAGNILTSDAAGAATWKAPLWLQSDTKIYYNNGYVGIGTNSPYSPLHIKTGVAEIVRFESSATSKWIALYQDNTRKGILWSHNDDIKLRSDAGALAFQTNGNYDRITITQDGKTGIGDTSPEATLDVEGTVVIGSGGKIFSEIREITGTTAGAGNAIVIQYPTGYTKENIRVLSCEINYNGNSWMGLGGTENPTTNISKVFYYLGSTIMIYYPANDYFQNRAFRMLVMKVQ